MTSIASKAMSPGRKFEIVYHFDVDLGQVEQLTDIIDTHYGSHSVFEIGSDISRASFNSLCDFLSGGMITISNSSYRDMKVLGNRLKSRKLLGMVEDFERSRESDLSRKIDYCRRVMNQFMFRTYFLGAKYQEVRKELASVKHLAMCLDEFCLPEMDVRCDGFDCTCDTSLCARKGDFVFLCHELESLESDAEELTLSCQNVHLQDEFEFSIKQMKVDSIQNDSIRVSFLEEKSDYGDIWSRWQFGKFLLNEKMQNREIPR